MKDKNNYSQKEGFFKSYKETQIFFQTWETPNPKLHIVVTHGHGEHSECYHRLVNFFANQNINFTAWDLRGHGRSEGKRGYVESFNDYIYDFEILIDQLEKINNDNIPTIYLAHSMGALIQNKYFISNTDFLPAAQVLSSPLFGFSLPVPSIKDKASRLLNLVYPKFTLWNEITHEMLTRDAEVIKEFEKDHLRHDLISSGIYLGMVENFELIKSQANKIKIPTFIQISETDPVVSTQAAKDFFQKIGSSEKRILLYGDGAKHEMYNDIHRENVYKDLKKFLEGFLK